MRCVVLVWGSAAGLIASGRARGWRGLRAVASEEIGRQHFIRDIVEKDLAAGRIGQVVLRFPPEPNGYLHVGHAKAICLNFGLAKDYAGRVHMRMDDTNPEKEEVKYERAILDDVRWLVGDGGDEPWDGEVRFASDYFDDMYAFATSLIERDLAYVDSQSAEEIRATRGTLKSPGTESPFRNRSRDENLELFRAMRAGDFEDGSVVLRAKIDMGSPNVNMRDPVLYRVRNARHARTGSTWPIYPMYDMAHALSDAIEGITHSLCTLEFQDHRPLYDWVVEQHSSWRDSPRGERPRQIEFSRLNLQYTVTSKRKLNGLVSAGRVEGWDDPRMPTISGMRRRGVPAAAVRLFCERVGISKAESRLDPSLLDDCTREILEETAPRAFCVLDPLRVELLDCDDLEELEAPRHPKFEALGTRRLRFGGGGDICVDRDDFWDTETQGQPPKGFNRLVPGGRARLRYAYVIECVEVLRDEAGAPTSLRCVVERDTRQGAVGAKGKVKGIIHWLRRDAAEPAPVKLYDRLFSVDDPTGDDLDDELNPESVRVYDDALVETDLDNDAVLQFERLGYFRRDGDSFVRVVPLRNTWRDPPKKPQPPLPPALDAASRLELVAGLVRSCEPLSEELWGLRVDCGDDEPRPVAAKLRAAYADGLANRRVVLLKNTKPRILADGFESRGLVLCAAADDDAVPILLAPPASAAPGDRLAPRGLHRVAPAAPSQVKNKKLWDKAQSAFSTTADHLVCVDGRPLLALPSDAAADDDDDLDVVVTAPGAPPDSRIV